jgi:hypothetical protein
VVDVIRFRPSFVVRGSAFEDCWIGDQLEAGRFKSVVNQRTTRGIDEVSSILRTVARHRGRRLRVYVGLAWEGSISIGDDILVASSDPSN